MANYAVRIYDEDLKAWLIAEAARRGTGVKTSDIVEAALRCYQTHIVHEGSDAKSTGVVLPEVSSPSQDRSDTPRARQTPVPLQDAAVAAAPNTRDLRVDEPTVMPDRILWPEHEFKEPPAAGTGGPIEPVLVYDEPVQRVKGPDSGPDEELGF